MSAKIDEIVSNMVSRFDDIHKIIENNQSQVTKSLNDAKVFVCNEIKHIFDELKKVEKRVSDLLVRVDCLERDKVSPDMVITGVPLANNMDPYQIVLDIINATGLQNGGSLLYKVFRPVLNRNAKSSPIIVKFINSQAKIKFYKSYVKLGNLNLSHIGFRSTMRIYCNDGLTRHNSAILGEARTLLKDKCISKFTTRKGQICIVLPGESTFIAIKSSEELHDLIAKHHSHRVNDESVLYNNIPLQQHINVPLQQQMQQQKKFSSIPYDANNIGNNNKAPGATAILFTSSTSNQLNKPVVSESLSLNHHKQPDHKLQYSSPTTVNFEDNNINKNCHHLPSTSSINSKFDSFVDEVIDDCNSIIPTTFVRKLRSNSKSSQDNVKIQ